MSSRGFLNRARYFADPLDGTQALNQWTNFKMEQNIFSIDRVQ